MQKPHTCLHRAARTFLQSACGMLTVILLAAAADWLPALSSGMAALFVLTSSAIAAGISALMNRSRTE